MSQNKSPRVQRSQWSALNLTAAIKFVNEGHSIHEAAKSHDIPYSTLQERIKKGLTESAPSTGRKLIFTGKQERALAEKIKYLANIFYGVTSQQICLEAYQFAEKNNIPHTFSKKKKCAGPFWLKCFLKRNSDISVKKSEAISLNHAPGFNRNNVGMFYNNLEKLIAKHNFPPTHIWNMGETDITTFHTSAQITVEKRQKRVGSITSGKQEQNVTVVCTMSAVGNFVAPMFVYPRQKVAPALSSGGPIDAIYHCSRNGGTNVHLFYMWLQHFVKHTGSTIETPVLLIYDDHANHISPEAYNYCQENGVVMLPVPPHTSHRLQPLDVTFFGPLTKAYHAQCEIFKKTRSLERITHYDLASIFNAAYVSVASIQTGVSGFSATGIYPFDRNIFSPNEFWPTDVLLQRATSNSDTNTPTIIPENIIDTVNIKDVPLIKLEPHTCNIDVHSELSSLGHAIKSESLTETSHSNEISNLAVTSLVTSILAQNASLENVSIENLQSLSDPVKTQQEQKSMIITSCPMKDRLEDAARRRQAGDQKEGIQSESKAKKKKDSLKKPKAKPIEESKKDTMEKLNKESVKKTRKSTRQEKKSILQSCKNTECHTTFDDSTTKLCSVCLEFGKDEEEWYRCGGCGKRAHGARRLAESADSFVCDCL